MIDRQEIKDRFALSDDAFVLRLRAMQGLAPLGALYGYTFTLPTREWARLSGSTVMTAWHAPGCRPDGVAYDTGVVYREGRGGPVENRLLFAYTRDGFPVEHVDVPANIRPWGTEFRAWVTAWLQHLGAKVVRGA